MEGREKNSAVHGIQMHETLEFEVHRIVRFAAVLGLIRSKEIFGPAAQTRYAPRNAEVVDYFLDAGGPSFGDRDHAIEGLFRQNFRKGGAHGRQRKRVAREGSADSSRVAIFEAVAIHDRVGDLLREAIGGARNSCADR